MSDLNTILLETANKIKDEHTIPQFSRDLGGYTDRVKYLQDLLKEIEPVYVKLQHEHPNDLEKIAVSWKSLLKDFSKELRLS